jgi:hypothetical protein
LISWAAVNRSFVAGRLRLDGISDVHELALVDVLDLWYVVLVEFIARSQGVPLLTNKGVMSTAGPLEVVERWLAAPVFDADTWGADVDDEPELPARTPRTRERPAAWARRDEEVVGQ